ncbi:hypothetical protein GGF31_008750 [Allomyces arbusculus]|nr:hypothetical protein GGF31_008750 [Allomyces arbusculus]
MKPTSLFEDAKKTLTVDAAIAKTVQTGGKMDKDAMATLTASIGEHTATAVSRDTLLAHTILLTAFHQLRDGANEAKNVAFLCTSEVRYSMFMNAVAKSIAKGEPVVEAPSLPLMDVAMFWHVHMHNYGDLLLGMDFPLLRMVR